MTDPLASPSVCSDFTFSMRSVLTILFKIVIHSPVSPSNSHLLFFLFHRIRYFFFRFIVLCLPRVECKLTNINTYFNFIP